MNLSNKLKSLLASAALLLIFVGWMVMRLNADVVGSGASGTPTVSISTPNDLDSVAQAISEASQKNDGSMGVTEIKLLATLTGNRGDFKAGDYSIPKGASLLSLFRKMVRGEVIPPKVRIAEGVTWREIKKVLASSELNHDAQSMDAAQVAQALNINAPSIEGMLFPDTYQYRKGEPETAVLKRAHELLLKKLNAEWDKRAANLPYTTPYDALIMASLIEKETGTSADRGMVASVFVNRLKVPMRLQTDPTVIYGMGESFDGNITKADLLRDTPYNTYTRSGLPPTPIATASLASIKAALNPTTSKALYFVARGDGSSEFSETLDAHNAAVQKYIKK